MEKYALRPAVNFHMFHIYLHIYKYIHILIYISYLYLYSYSLDYINIHIHSQIHNFIHIYIHFHFMLIYQIFLLLFITKQVKIEIFKFEELNKIDLTSIYQRHPQAYVSVVLEKGGNLGGGFL